MNVPLNLWYLSRPLQTVQPLDHAHLWQLSDCLPLQLCGHAFAPKETVSEDDSVYQGFQHTNTNGDDSIVERGWERRPFWLYVELSVQRQANQGIFV